ncbi:hypothetical protein VNO77_04936 [Canavalia gladiata]|uniref:Uncharacterized protein n=1 Tax=Canavalia gladiata TaxID=3824 RepID=A0AAN9N3Y2_CANGL
MHFLRAGEKGSSWCGKHRITFVFAILGAQSATWRTWTTQSIEPPFVPSSLLRSHLLVSIFNGPIFEQNSVPFPLPKMKPVQDPSKRAILQQQEQYPTQLSL